MSRGRREGEAEERPCPIYLQIKHFISLLGNVTSRNHRFPAHCPVQIAGCKWLCGPGWRSDGFKIWIYVFILHSQRSTRAGNHRRAAYLRREVATLSSSCSRVPAGDCFRGAGERGGTRGGDRPCLSFPRVGCLGVGIPPGTSPAWLHPLPGRGGGHPWGCPASPRRSGIPVARKPGAPRAHRPPPRRACPAWAGPVARLPGRPRQPRSHALLIPPGTCPSSRRLRASKEPINPPGARGSGSGSSSSPANEGRGAARRGRAGCRVARPVSRARCPASRLPRGGKWVN